MLKLFNTLKNKITSSFKIKFAKRNRKKFSKLISIENIKENFDNRNEEYDYFFNFFWNLSHSWLKDHRAYFTKENRGFGEDAFHAMWFLIFSEHKPKKILEIGVYRGQTISLFRLLSDRLNLITEIHGISPFTSSGDEVSEYMDNLDYKKDVINNFDFFSLKHPILHKGFSDEATMIDIINSEKWDLIYIDGNHDYNVAKLDFDNCSKALNIGGLLVLDDSSLYTDYRPTFYSTSGHPGPSKVANEIDNSNFIEILSVGHNRVFKKLSNI
jgi:hypothetical protein